MKRIKDTQESLLMEFTLTLGPSILSVALHRNWKLQRMRQVLTGTKAITGSRHEAKTANNIGLDDYVEGGSGTQEKVLAAETSRPH